MCSLGTVFLGYVILSGLFRPHVCQLSNIVSPFMSAVGNEDENTIDGRQCKPLKECEFYQQFEKKDISELLRKAIKNELLREACGLNRHREVVKGKLKLIIVVL